jgi:hypothetical protein
MRFAKKGKLFGDVYFQQFKFQLSRFIYPSLKCDNSKLEKAVCAQKSKKIDFLF